MAVRVFISYSHDSVAHRQRVLWLGQELRARGIDAWIDQFDEVPPPGSWAMWMLDQIDRADLVIAICTSAYRRRVEGKEIPGKGLGSRWEGAILTQQLYEQTLSSVPARIIPVLLDGEEPESIPLVLRGTTHYRIGSEDPKSARPLIAHLTGDAPVKPIPLGATGVVDQHMDVRGPLAESSSSFDLTVAMPEIDAFDLTRVLGSEGLAVGSILDRWGSTSKGGELVLGMSPTGMVHWDPATEGPHLLVAGTTGSGKSELLQSFIANLALCYSPAEWNILLIDYKGGAAFSSLVDLPHCLGLVTDLDAHNTERMWTMLMAEMRRRERVLQAEHAYSIEKLRPSASPALPRLLIVVDEFAALFIENPRLVELLYRLGMAGRSLGIHIVYSTQRAASISETLLANVATRIALRMVDTSESVTLIGSAQASSIPRDLPGTAFIQTREQQLVGFRAPFISWHGSEGTPTTASVVRAVEAAVENGRYASAPRWSTDGLAQTYLLHQLPRRDGERALGVVDRPEEFGPDLWSTEDGRVGNLEVVGTAGSGKSTALRSIAAALATIYEPESLAIHLIDFGPDRGITSIRVLPHVRTVIDGSSSDEALAFLERLAAVTDFSGRPDSAGAFSSNDQALHHLVLIDDIHRWLDGRDAPAVAVSRILATLSPTIDLVFSTDLSGSLRGRVGPVNRRLVLRLSNADDYRMFDVSPTSVSRHAPPGRGVLLPGGTPVQVATLAAGGKQAQTDALVALAEAVRAASA